MRARQIILLCIAKNESKISFEGESVLIHPSLQFCAHSAQVHRLCDYIEVTEIKRLNEERSGGKKDHRNALRGVVPYWIDRLFEKEC